MNVKLLRAEWRAVRRASMRLMHHSLSMVGLLSVGVAVVVVTHPEVAHTVGRWVLPRGVAPSVVPTAAAAAQPDPLVGRDRPSERRGGASARAHGARYRRRDGF